jgi:hypothetical protein
VSELLKVGATTNYQEQTAKGKKGDQESIDRVRPRRTTNGTGCGHGLRDAELPTRYCNTFNMPLQNAELPTRYCFFQSTVLIERNCQSAIAILSRRPCQNVELATRYCFFQSTVLIERNCQRAIAIPPHNVLSINTLFSDY